LIAVVWILIDKNPRVIRSHKARHITREEASTSLASYALEVIDPMPAGIERYRL
jgi:hypothetical protein